MLMAEILLTVEQTAQRLQLAPLTVRRQLQRGSLRGIKRGRVWRIPESALTETVPADEPVIVARDGQNFPVIAGTGIKVAHLAALKQAENLAPEDLQKQFPQLSLAQVYGALAFYYEHQSELDADIARREKRATAWEREGRKHQPSRRDLQRRSQQRHRLSPKVAGA
jgi:excisionase family DNA binding protein